MANIVNIRARKIGDAVDTWLGVDDQDQRGDQPKDTESRKKEHEREQKVHGKLLNWYYEEREIQALNRYQMAVDADFYDGLQWEEEDAAAVEERGQKPLTFNEVAPMIDWLIGTERRMRFDWKVLPRAEDDVQLADVKTKLMKYVSDANKVPMARSRAFGDAVKVGIGWMEDGARKDPTGDPIYSRFVPWREMLWDSRASELDCSDGRYMFRWRWIDLDVAIAMYPKKEAALRRSAWSASSLNALDTDDLYYLGQNLSDKDSDAAQLWGRRTFISDPFVVAKRRQRVRLIEGWFRLPCEVKRLEGPVFDGEEYDDSNAMMKQAVEQGACDLVSHVTMKMHYAIFTEKELIAMGPSPYKHDKFPYTPTFCYRRSRDGLPYGAIRRVRDVQDDLNKRASKALFNLSTNQIIADEGAVEDPTEAREEADRPDGYIAVKQNKRFEIRNNADIGQAQLALMEMDAAKIKSTTGINDENLGRQSNASSGEAIKARQLQGSVSTTEPFDNYRYSFQVQGEKQLSLAEQYYSLPKVIRITGANPGAIEWVRINQPEPQPDGSVRWLNDITASQADFIVSEQDYHGTLRQVMFEQMMQAASKTGEPQTMLRLMRIAFEYSDFPNKQEVVAEFRKVLGEPDPNKQLTPEEMEMAEKARAAQAAMEALNQAAAEAAVQKTQAEVKKINAEAERALAEIAGIGAGGGIPPEELQRAQDEVNTIRERAAQEVERLTEQLVAAQADLRNRSMEMDRKATTDERVATIKAEAEKYSADAQRASEKAIAPIQKSLEALTQQIAEMSKKHAELEGEHKKVSSTVEKTVKEKEQEKAEERGRAKGEKDGERKAKEAATADEKATKLKKDTDVSTVAKELSTVVGKAVKDGLQTVAKEITGPMKEVVKASQASVEMAAKGVQATEQLAQTIEKRRKTKRSVTVKNADGSTERIDINPED